MDVGNALLQGDGMGWGCFLSLLVLLLQPPPVGLGAGFASILSINVNTVWVG